MYEDTKFKSNFNWKSLIFKLGILLLIVFLICFIIFKPKKDKNFISLASNINTVKESATEYFKNNFNLKEIGDHDKVTLKELINEEYASKQEDSKGNSCNEKKSFAYLTKTRDDEFVLKINMKCGKNEESKVFNLNSKDLTVVANKEEEKQEVIEEEILVEEEVTEDPVIKEEIIEDTEIADNSTTNKEETESNIETIYFNNEELIEELHNQNSNKKLRYKHIKYGEWLEGSKEGENIQNSTKNIYYYEYCYNDYCILDKLENAVNYEGYTATYKYTETIPVYRYIFVVWSNTNCIKGFINTGITEYR